MYPIDIIGMGLSLNDLTEKHLGLIRDCEVLVGGERLLKPFEGLKKELIPIKGAMARIVELIREKAENHKLVVLASGDPLYYGIGSTLIQYFDKTRLNIHSNISSVSAAFAAIREPWHDARIISLHGKKEAEAIQFSMLASENKIAFLTSPGMGPGFIAERLIKEGLYEFRCCVLENLGSPEKEIITWFDNMDLVRKQSFSEPNVVILLKRVLKKTHVSCETHIGMNDSLFKHTKGLITKSEIRSITLSKLKLIKKDHVLWDIGAGSGSVGIEASFLIPWGLVYSIEKNPERISDIIHNIKNFNCSNVKVVNLEFPNDIEELRTPDRIFIGGHGDMIEPIMDICCEKLAPFGAIVVNTVLLQSMDAVLKSLEKHQFKVDMVQIQISRSKAMVNGNRLEAMNPVWIISGTKQG